MTHHPVMLDEAIAGLAVAPHGIYVDATFGRGGHTRAILGSLAGDGAVYALDRDPAAAAHAWREFAGDARLHFLPAGFDTLAAIAAEAGIAGRVSGVLFDLGVSSPQLDDPARGFSFAKEGPLDMRMDPRAGESAAQWLARAPEGEIADVLWQLGEERNSRRIARALVERRRADPIASTTQLAELVLSLHRGPWQRIHPATRTFQALRIHVNDELGALERVLPMAAASLAVGGRLVVISFHSLEDRIVKRFIRGAAAADAPVRLRKLGRTFPTDAESERNPRARSAVLRVAERIA